MKKENMNIIQINVEKKKRYQIIKKRLLCIQYK
jgi:hypothetical protein